MPTSRPIIFPQHFDKQNDVQLCKWFWNPTLNLSLFKEQGSCLCNGSEALMHCWLITWYIWVQLNYGIACPGIPSVTRSVCICVLFCWRLSGSEDGPYEQNTEFHIGFRRSMVLQQINFKLFKLAFLVFWHYIARPPKHFLIWLLVLLHLTSLSKVSLRFLSSANPFSACTVRFFVLLCVHWSILNLRLFVEYFWWYT